jgi:hypothetical protein
MRRFVKRTEPVNALGEAVRVVDDKTTDTIQDNCTQKGKDTESNAN